MERILKLGRQSRGMARCHRAIRAFIELSRGMTPRHITSFGFIALISVLCTGSLFAQDDGRTIKPVNAARKVALVMGNSAYRNRPLANPANDARDVGARLRELGFDADIVLDGGRKQMAEGIDRFLNKLRTGDVALFYFSGHGAQIDGENYLIPVDFEGQNETDVRYDAHAAGRIQERMERSGAQLNIIVLDACRDNPYRSSSRDVAGGLAAMNAGRGTFVAFATAPGRMASDNSRGRNGLFTQYFLEALRQPGLGLDDVFNAVRQHVDESSGGKQLPWTQSAVVGRFTFVAGGTTTPAPVGRDVEVGRGAGGHEALAKMIEGTWTAQSGEDARFKSNGRRFHGRYTFSLQISRAGDEFTGVWHETREYKGLDSPAAAADNFTRQIDARFHLWVTGGVDLAGVSESAHEQESTGYKVDYSAIPFKATIVPGRLTVELVWRDARGNELAALKTVLEKRP